MSISILLLSIHIYARNTYSAILNTANGLPDNTIRDIYQDSRGYLWFGTFNGLSRYDGYRIRTIQPLDGKLRLADNQIRSITEDSNGYLWIIGANGSVGAYNIAREEFVPFISEGEGRERYLHLKEMPDKSIWLWGDNGILRITPESETSLKSEKIVPPRIDSNEVILVEAGEGNRVFISTDRGLWVWNKGEISAVDKTRRYQWLIPTGNFMIGVALNGDIVKIQNGRELSVIGKIPGVDQSTMLPGYFIMNDACYIFSTAGNTKIDLKSLKQVPMPAELDIKGAHVIIDNIGDFWIHNGTGLLYFVNHKKRGLDSIRVIPENMVRLMDMERYSISRDADGKAWIATAGNGLFVFNPADGSLEHYSQADQDKLITTDRLLSTAVDRNGNVWIGSENGGLSMLQRNVKGTEKVIFPGNEEVGGVRSIDLLEDGKIALNAKNGTQYRFSSSLAGPVAVERDVIIYDATTDLNGHLWEATRGKGLYLNGQPVGDAIPATSSKDIFAVFSDHMGNLWVGTFGAGLDLYVRKNGKYEKRNFLADNYARKRIRTIFEDSRGNIWVGTNDGAFLFDRSGLTAANYTPRQFSIYDQTLSSNEVHCFIEDDKGRIWVGLASGGIDVLDFSKNKNKPEITQLREGAGLVNENIQAFVKDKSGNIWATTLYGVSKINPSTLEIESYVFMPDPEDNVHSSNSAILLPDGRLLFGTNKGAYTIDPSKIEFNNNNNPISVTSFMVNGVSLPLDESSKGVSLKDGVWHIKLPYNENNLELEFSTFDFGIPKVTKFRYKLEPVDEDWNNLSGANSLSLKNLRSGAYTLIIEAAGADGKWDRRLELKINIGVPWWASWWAKCIYLLLILSGILIIVLVIKRIDSLHNKVKVEEQLTDYKLEFFTNISHEFRTPLTLIQVSLEKLHDAILNLKTQNPGMHLSGLKNPLATLDKNTRRMSRLIDELLTFRKVEKGKLVLNPETTEIIGFLHDIFDNFEDEAKSKRMNYVFEADPESYEMNIDRNAIEKIANNLISNALKYTREGGCVIFSVKVDESSHKLVIKVQDNGVGIPVDKRENLFSRFMQSAMSRNSIGVGLHLTFGLVELHKGTIKYEENPGGGSVFIVSLPTDMKASEHKHDDTIGRPLFDTIFREDTVQEKEPEEIPVAEVKEMTRKMLIIDDDADIRKFLQQEFSRYYMILLASDGQSGLEVARNNDVHIIICDVMMPDMSGFEVTRLLKEDFATSHIPIIQLTALTDDDCQMEGITSGADAYVTKPFNLKFLMTRVAKLIEQRENLFAKFSATPTLARPELPMGNRDKEFAEKLAEIAEKNLDNSEFTVDDFASEMALGRTIFFRKVKGVTGYAPKEYLRVMRMKKAAELLLTTDMTITEIAFAVGMSDPAYFTKCFKAQFGKSPSVYQKENTSKPE